MFLSATQGPSATPRATCIPLYLPHVRTKLVRMFYAAFPQEAIKAMPALKAIESILLSNVVTSTDCNPVCLLANSDLMDYCLGSEAAELFVANVLASTPQSEDTKASRLAIRDTAFSRPGSDILLHSPLAGIVTANQAILGIACKTLSMTDIMGKSKTVGTCINFLINLFHSCTESEFNIIQCAPESTNVLLALIDLAIPQQDKPLVSEELSVLEIRHRALTALSVAVSVSTDPITLLRLKRSGSPMTIAKKVFDALFSELLLESFFRSAELPGTYSAGVKIRARRIRDSVNILVRLACTFLESPGHKSPLDDYSLMIPSLLGLMRALLAKPSNMTAEIDEVLTEIMGGDLNFIKELGVPELAGTPFELEKSIW